MNQLMRITLLFVLTLMVLNSAHAWNIGNKGRVNGPSIHSTYFLTPNNSNFGVHAKALVGTWANNACQYSATYDIGAENLSTGDFVDIDAYQLKSVVGGGYSCMSIYYNYKQLVIESFQLVWDGFNYDTTVPATSEVTIL